MLIKLSQEYEVFYMERRTYRDNKVFKSYLVKIGDLNEEFKNQTDLLVFLKGMI